MSAWIWLAGAVVASLAANLALRTSAASGRGGWLAASLAAIVLSLVFVARALAGGMPLALGYGVWTGGSVALAALVGRTVFRERLGRRQLAGLACVLVGSLALHLGAGA